MKTAEFDFDLPPELIALRPAPQRDGSCLLILNRDGTIEHKSFISITDYLSKGDMLVLNDTKVLPVRLIGNKSSGGKVDIILVKEEPKGVWEVLSRGSYAGTVQLSGGVTAELSLGGRQLIFTGRDSSDIYGILELCGAMPIPPYIKRMPDDEDRHRYQTVYADKPGSIAAPTAGLHFTPELVALISARGVLVRRITLHVGPGTFKPITATEISDHQMQPEYFEVEKGLPGEMQAVKAAGKRVVTVGTTATRALEGLLGGIYCPDREGNNGHFQGHTGIFICPGHKFLAADALLTNFHLPRSTPLMLAAAFCGLENLMMAYRAAIARGYRFFSYGDAMLIL